MLRVKVVDYDVIEIKPKLTQKVLQYVILTEDEFGHSEVFFVDENKYNKEKLIEAIKLKFSARYKIPKDDVQVSFLVDIS